MKNLIVSVVRHPLNMRKLADYKAKLDKADARRKALAKLPPADNADCALFKNAAIHIHAHYPELIEEMIVGLGAFARRNIYFRITVNQPSAETFAKQVMSQSGFLKYDAMLVPNRGRDLGPLFTACKDMFRDYHYVCHLHTKKSPHLPFGDTWRQHLVGNLIGSDSQILRQLAFMEANSNCGVLYPENFSKIQLGVAMNRNREKIDALINCLGSDWRYEDLDFPAGSMCWLNSNMLRPIIDRLPPIEAYDEEAGQLDGTLAHALERCLSLIPYNCGFRSVAFSVNCSPKKGPV